MIEERLSKEYRVYCDRCQKALTEWATDLPAAKEVYRVHVTEHIEQDK